MQIVLIIIGVLLLLGVVAAIAGSFRNRKLQAMVERGEIDKITDPQKSPDEGCGQPET